MHLFLIIGSILTVSSTSAYIETFNTAQTTQQYGATRVSLEPHVNFNTIPYMKTWNVDFMEDAIGNSPIPGNHVILYPEYMVSSIEVRNDRELALQFAQQVPDIGVNPCQTFSATNVNQEVMRNVSCIASKHNVYLVFNTPETDADKLYSTTVVFEPSGKVIARYRKSHLYDESAMDAYEVEKVTFTTQNNVTFGLLTAFDLMFKSPAMDLLEDPAVTEILVSFAWSGKLPFLTPYQLLAGWYESSLKTKASNMLAGCYLKPTLGYTGCEDHFAGNGYVRTFNDADYCDYDTLGCSAQTSMTSNVTSAVSATSQRARGNLTYSAYSNLANFTSKLIPTDVLANSMEVCHGDLCCTLDYKFNSIPKNSFYQFMVYDGLWYQNLDAWDVQVCALVACSGEDISSCADNNAIYPSDIEIGSLRISGLFQTELVMPTTLVAYEPMDIPMKQISLVKQAVNSRHHMIVLNMEKTTNNVLTFGLHSHDFHHTPPSATPNGNSHVNGSLNLICLLFIAVFIHSNHS